MRKKNISAITAILLLVSSIGFAKPRPKQSQKCPDVTVLKKVTTSKGFEFIQIKIDNKIGWKDLKTSTIWFESYKSSNIQDASAASAWNIYETARRNAERKKNRYSIPALENYYDRAVFICGVQGMRLPKYEDLMNVSEHGLEELTNDFTGDSNHYWIFNEIPPFDEDEGYQTFVYGPNPNFFERDQYNPQKTFHIRGSQGMFLESDIGIKCVK